jgi:hypothetical protein
MLMKKIHPSTMGFVLFLSLILCGTLPSAFGDDVESEKGIESAQPTQSDLPPEILHSIFMFLDNRSLSNVSQVNHNWNDLSSSVIRSYFSRELNLVEHPLREKVEAILVHSFKTLDPQSLFELLKMIQKGLTKSFFTPKIAALYLKSADSKNGVAQNNLGILFSQSLGVEQNYEAAKNFWESSANQGNVDAACNLLSLEINGIATVLTSPEKSEHFANLSQKTDSERLKTQFMVIWAGIAVSWNTNGPVSYKNIIDVLIASASGSTIADAQYRVGLLYYYGDGIEQSSEKAQEYFARAAEQGNENAKKALNELF